MPTPADYKAARALAVKDLLGSDVEACCQRAGLTLQPVSGGGRKIPIPFLLNTYHLLLTEDQASFLPREPEMKIPDQVLLLHYLLTASGKTVRQNWITFREVPSGPFYYPSFVKRAITPLVQSFGNNLSGFETVSEKIGEKLESPGDIAVKVMALPRVPVVLSLWAGDDEFPPEGNVYFDASVSSYLPTEDIAYVAGSVVYTTMGLFRRLDSS